MSRRLISIAGVIVACAAVGACGGGGADGDAPDAAEESLLEPPPPGEGFQLVMNTTVPAGVELEHCMFVEARPDTFYINRGEVRYTAGSHHVLLYETPYTEIPTQKEDGTVVDTSGVFDCTDGATNGWRINRVIGGSQNGDGESAVGFPPGVAMEVPGGHVLMINAHYINASDQVMEPEIRLNLWTIPSEDVTDLGDILFIYNPFIRASANGGGRARWQCPVHQDITLVNVQSHMHARGVAYEAAVLGQEPFYVNERWEDVPIGRFDPGMVIPAGSVLDYHCDYANGEARDVYQGPRTTDEMCMLLGSYYPADSRTSNCRDVTGQYYGGTWVGEGDATCSQSWDCINTAANAGTRVVEGVTDCLLASDPAIAKELSAALACAIDAQNVVGECGSLVQTCQSM